MVGGVSSRDAIFARNLLVSLMVVDSAIFFVKTAKDREGLSKIRK